MVERIKDVAGDDRLYGCLVWIWSGPVNQVLFAKREEKEPWLGLLELGDLLFEQASANCDTERITLKSTPEKIWKK